MKDRLKSIRVGDELRAQLEDAYSKAVLGACAIIALLALANKTAQFIIGN